MQLTTTVVNSFLKILEAEVNEKVICCALEALSLWVNKFRSDVPKKVIDAVKVRHFLSFSFRQIIANCYLEWYREQISYPTNEDILHQILNDSFPREQHCSSCPVGSNTFKMHRKSSCATRAITAS